MTFNNYLITRFNIPYKKLYRKNNNEEKWMEERKKLFERYCLPSVLNQDNKNFKWLIGISPNTEQENMKYFRKIKQKFGGIRLIEIDSFYEVDRHIGKYILKDTKEGEYLSTSRLDTDDMISRTFMGRIEEIFNYQKRKPISWSTGYQMLLDDGIQIRKVRYPKGPFKSLIEVNNGHVETVHGKEHMKWNDEKVVSNKPYWIQVIHDSNVSGHVINGIPATNLDLADKFGIDIKYNTSIGNYVAGLSKYLKNEIGKGVLKIKKRIDGSGL